MRLRSCAPVPPTTPRCGLLQAKQTSATALLNAGCAKCETGQQHHADCLERVWQVEQRPVGANRRADVIELLRM